MELTAAPKGLTGFSTEKCALSGRFAEKCVEHAGFILAATSKEKTTDSTSEGSPKPVTAVERPHVER